MKHGKGKLTFSSGDTYVGDFESNVRQGQGIFTYAETGNTVRVAAHAQYSAGTARSPQTTCPPRGSPSFACAPR